MRWNRATACVVVCVGLGAAQAAESRTPTEAEASEILRTLLSVDRPDAAVVFVSEGGNPTASRAEIQRAVEQGFANAPASTPEARAEIQRSIERNTERLFLRASGGRVYKSAYRRTSEGTRLDFTDFGPGAAIEPLARPDQTMVRLRGDGERTHRLIDHLARRIILQSGDLADPPWMRHGGRSPEGLRMFVITALTPVIGAAIEPGTEPTAAMIGVLRAEPGTVPKWQWRVQLTPGDGGTQVVAFTQENLREPVVEVTFPDNTFATVTRMVVRNPTSGKPIYRREVQSTRADDLPIVFTVEEFRGDDSSPKRTRFSVDSWSAEQGRGTPDQIETPLLAEDLSGYETQDMRRK